MVLDISPDVDLPLEAVTETFALIAKRRVGKSNAAVVMAEQMYDAGIPWVAIDPKGDWWGVRSSADGAHDGLSVIVFGGEHGDVPLLADAGTYMADLVAEQRISCVLDVSDFSKTDEVKFLYAFATRLLKVNRHPLHIFFEECDDYIPQSMVRDVGGISEAQLVRAFSKLVRQGGFKGIGSTLVTQRPALVNNNVLSQTETMIALRTTFPDDQAKVKSWVSGHASKAQTAEIMDSLSSLALGEAWVISPAFLGSVQRTTFHRRRTFDSGATPKLGEDRREPTRLADVDLAAIKEAMADTIERHKADDPAELRKRIKDLERRLAERPAEKVVETVTETVEVPVITDDDLATVASIVDLHPALERAAAAVLTLAERIGDVRRDRQDVPRTRPAGDGAPAGRLEGGRAPQRPDPPSRRDAGRPPVPRAAPAEGLSDPQQRILDSLAWFASVGIAPTDRSQLALHAGVSPSSGSYGQNLGALRARGLVDYPSKGMIGLTGEGHAAAAPADVIRTSEELHSALLGRLPGPQATILRLLIDAYPDDVDRSELAISAGVSPSSGSYGQNLGALRALKLIDYPARGRIVALPILFLPA